VAAAHVPKEIFAAKPALAVQMISRAIAADVPFLWAILSTLCKFFTLCTGRSNNRHTR